MVLTFWLKGKEYNLQIEPQLNGPLLLTHEGITYEVTAEFITEEEILIKVNGQVYNVLVQSNSLAHTVVMGDRKYLVEKKAPVLYSKEQKTSSKRREVRITMPGKVVAVQVKDGSEVTQGQPVLILEAMKMQNEIKAPKDGRITNLKVKPGDTVEAGTILFIME